MIDTLQGIYACVCVVLECFNLQKYLCSDVVGSSGVCRTFRLVRTIKGGSKILTIKGIKIKREKIIKKL